jgi:NitT/TauT family transport system substrate-binding protein
MQIVQSRRRFLASASLAGAAGLVGLPRSPHAEPPPETTTIRLEKIFGAICQAPEFVAGELLRAEGFTDVRYVEGDSLLERGELDFDVSFAPMHVAAIDAGLPITVLAGLHSGCFELFANESVHSVMDLRGKRMSVQRVTSRPSLLVTIMIAYVGLDPLNDIHWLPKQEATSMELFIEGKTDAFLGVPPEPQELRARKIGHTIVNSTVDRPWSQYFCCTLAVTADYMTKHPVATKRALRAILKTTDLCVSAPKRVAQELVAGGFTDRYDYALQSLNDSRFDWWRDYDPEDTLRFYALRMHEAGMIKSGPQRIIAEGTDWRFLDELKRELKA